MHNAAFPDILGTAGALHALYGHIVAPAHLCRNAQAKEAYAGTACGYEKARARELSRLSDEIYTGVNVLSEAVSASDAEDGSLERAMRYKDGVISAMNALREACDAAESVIPKGVWPLPSYTDILTSVK